MDSRLFDECIPSRTPLEVHRVNQDDGWALFAFANMGTAYDLRISIDDHAMWTITADGNYHIPQLVDVRLYA